MSPSSISDVLFLPRCQRETLWYCERGFESSRVGKIGAILGGYRRYGHGPADNSMTPACSDRHVCSTALTSYTARLDITKLTWGSKDTCGNVVSI